MQSFVILEIIFLARLAASLCPDLDTSLHEWSSASTWDSGSLPPSGSVVNIDRPVLLDVTNITVCELNIVGNGRLVISDQVGDVTITAEGISVRGSGSFIIGSEDCRFQNQVNIKLNGSRTSNRALVGEEGEKYIFVADQGSLQFYGQDKLAWTKLSKTVERWAVDTDNIVYDHDTSNYFSKHRGFNGPAMYIFNSDDLQPRLYKVYGIDVGGDIAKEQTRMEAMIEALNGVQEGEIVAIAMQNLFKTTAKIEDLFTTLETVANITHVALRDLYETDAYSLVFQKGGDASEVYDMAVGKAGALARANIVVNGNKVVAVSCMKCTGAKSHIKFRILKDSIGFPTISVLDSVSTWRVGDEVIVTSTDYSSDHTEVTTIKEVSSNTIKLADEFDYRHFGEIESGVDMRAEVALLTRNIKIEGIMARGCPEENENCNEFDYDTYGAHLKIVNFTSIHIEGVEFVSGGQSMDKGHYPMHFHMCEDVSNREAVIKSNSIHNSYRRAITVHGTYGHTEEQHGVVLSNNVAYNILGHAYFLEDGAEKATILDRNLGATVKSVNVNGFTTDRTGPSVFWITNPKAKLTNNVAVGGDVGYWYVFPEIPVGPSAGLGTYQYREAPQTPLWKFDNNVAHSNKDAGFKFDNILEDENGNIAGCMNYKPVANPLDKNSDNVKVQLTRFTSYKNKQVNCWLRGGWVEVIQYSCAESRRCLTFARGSDQNQFVSKSIVIGRSRGNSEGPDYPDAPTATDLPHYLGVVFRDGPIHIDKVWFNGFESVEGQYVAGALGFATKNKVSSSIASNTTDIRFGFVDKVDGSGGNRVFDGTIEDEDFGFGNFDGDESATFRDGDGSVTACPGHDWSRPVQIVKPEKYAITDKCMKRDNWQLAVCHDNYGKIRIDVDKDFNDANTEHFPAESQSRRLNRLNTSDVAYEDHTGEKRPEYLAILGSEKYYYQIQFLQDFPQQVSLKAKGAERNYPVIAGICLPEGLSPSDVRLIGRRPPSVTRSSDDWISVDSIDKLFEDETMTRFYLEGRILHVRLVNTLRRESHWDRCDTDHCPSGDCPEFTIQILTDDITDYTPCFTPTEEELKTDVHLEDLPSLTCDLTASLPEPDWGAGDTTRSAVNGEWGSWSSWSDCCADQDSDTFRYRLCDNPTPFGNALDCSGKHNETKACTTECPVNGQLSQWTRWSDCFCDGIAAGSSGARTRTRDCAVAHYGQFCLGDAEQTQPCYGDCE